ncbi:MAG: CopG family transcriptional regulator [Lachnospiraceae bacterium]|nr:CopG family transcriptional regulator [Lachnospiraceae bacterium]
MAKMGRPPAENPKMYKVTVRMSEPDYNKLMKYNESTDQTITETMLEGFTLLMKKKAKKA